MLKQVQHDVSDLFLISSRYEIILFFQFDGQALKKGGIVDIVGKMVFCQQNKETAYIKNYGVLKGGQNGHYISN
ncbi:MAG: hypothetical protein HY764_01645 [Candidatus Portnoybacteria bacterium]|nr:hypothetical protein [Candidatus Portnoybacteria bacterium]